MVVHLILLYLMSLFIRMQKKMLANFLLSWEWRRFVMYSITINFKFYFSKITSGNVIQ